LRLGGGTTEHCSVGGVRMFMIGAERSSQRRSLSGLADLPTTGSGDHRSEAKLQGIRERRSRLPRLLSIITTNVPGRLGAPRRLGNIGGAIGAAAPGRGGSSAGILTKLNAGLGVVLIRQKSRSGVGLRASQHDAPDRPRGAGFPACVGFRRAPGARHDHLQSHAPHLTRSPRRRKFGRGRGGRTDRAA